MAFNDFIRRHFAVADPNPEPPSPCPFMQDARVVLSLPPISGGIGLDGVHGTVLETKWSEMGWAVKVRLDRHSLEMWVVPAELNREPKHMAPTVDPAAVDDESGEDYAAEGEVPDLALLTQKMRELAHEKAPLDTPVYDQVTAEAHAVDGFAAQVERDLAAWTGGAR